MPISLSVSVIINEAAPSDCYLDGISQSGESELNLGAALSRCDFALISPFLTHLNYIAPM